MAACGTQEDGVVTLIVENERIRVSKKLLCEKSGYFRSMFSLPMKESNQNEVTLHDAHFVPFEFIIDFECCTDRSLAQKLLESKDIVNLVDILFDADRCQFWDFCKAAKKQILTYVRENGFHPTLACELLSRRDILEILDLNSVINQVLIYMDSNAVELLESRCPLQLPVSFICDILKRDTFLVPERMILAFVMDYLHDHPEVDPHLLLNCVRLNTIERKDISKVMRASRKKMDLLPYMKRMCEPRICAKKDQDLNVEPYTTGFKVELLEESVEFGPEFHQVDYQTYKLFTMSFDIFVKINTIKFRIEEIPEESVYSKDVPTYQFVLDIRVGKSWKRLYNSNMTDELFTWDDIHVIRIETSVVNAVRLEIRPSNFFIKEFHCLHSSKDKQVGHYRDSVSWLQYRFHYEYEFYSDSSD